MKSFPAVGWAMGLFSLLLLSSSVHAASFDCRLAKSPVEKAICSNPHLSALDDELGRAYQDALKKAGEGDVVVRRDQEAWLSSLREDCSGAQIVSCIERQDTARIRVLKQTRAFDAGRVTEYKLTNASSHFDFAVRLFAKPAEAGDDTRDGPGHVLIFLKGQSQPMQTIAMTNIFVSLDKAGRPLVNSARLYDYQGVINVGDFNFDGQEDIAIQNGNEASYGGPSYDVYLFALGNHTFVFNRSMTELIAGSLGFFQVDSKKKQLVTLTKDGCCYHLTTTYEVINNQPEPVFREIEDATKSDTYVVVTDQRRVDGKWTKGTTKRIPQSKNQ
jgi:uncharacterized protein YecT (DUF1311 family)